MTSGTAYFHFGNVLSVLAEMEQRKIISSAVATDGVTKSYGVYPNSQGGRETEVLTKS